MIFSHNSVIARSRTAATKQSPEVLPSAFQLNFRRFLRRANALLAMTLLLLLFTPNFSRAQTPGEQEYIVLGISVEGNISGNAETIIAQSTIRKGDKIQTDAIRRAISRLWQQGIFS